MISSTPNQLIGCQFIEVQTRTRCFASETPQLGDNNCHFML